MRIVYCIDHLRLDGTQRILCQLVRGLSLRGHEQAVVCLNDSWDEEVVKDLQRAKAEVRILGKASLAWGYGLLSTWQWLRHSRFDVAVTLLFASDVVGRALARAAGVPRIISSLRARNMHYREWQRWLVRRTMRWVDAVVLNSGSVREFVLTKEGVQPNKIWIIPNGVLVEAPSISSNPASLRAELGLPSEGYLIGGVGRLEKQKGFDVLLQALALSGRKDIDLLIVGIGREEANLRRQAAALNLGQRIHFAGFRRDVPRLLKLLDLYVQASRFEGMPNALLEAMAAQCPVIATEVDGNRELVEDGVHGWLIPAEDPRALAQAIQTALSDPQEAKRRASAAQNRVATQFSLQAMIAAWERLLQSNEFRVQTSFD